MENFLANNQVRLNKTAETAATSAIDGAVVDMSGFDSATFFCTIATANAGNYLKVEQGDAADLSDGDDLAGTKTVAAANGDVVAVEVFRPTKRYIRPMVIRAGASTATGEIYQILSGARVLPVNNNVADLIVSETHLSPAEGTA